MIRKERVVTKPIKESEETIGHRRVIISIIGTVNVIPSDPPCKDCNARSSMN